MSLVTVSPVITAFHSCCLSHHVFDQINLRPAWVGLETAIFWQCSTGTVETQRLYPLSFLLFFLSFFLCFFFFVFVVLFFFAFFLSFHTFFINFFLFLFSFSLSFFSCFFFFFFCFLSFSAFFLAFFLFLFSFLALFLSFISLFLSFFLSFSAFFLSFSFKLCFLFLLFFAFVIFFSLFLLSFLCLLNCFERIFLIDRHWCFFSTRQYDWCPHLKPIDKIRRSIFTSFIMETMLVTKYKVCLVFNKKKKKNIKIYRSKEKEQKNKIKENTKTKYNTYLNFTPNLRKGTTLRPTNRHKLLFGGKETPVNC